MLSDLKALRDIISSSIDTIIEAYESAGVEFHALNEPLQGPRGTPPTVLHKQPEVIEAVAKIVASSSQLIACVQDPYETLQNFSYSFYFTAALGIAEAGNVAEILRQAGPNGMHIKDIAVRSGMHPKKLAVAMYYLVTRHVFREVAPDVFANNMISSILDSGLPADDKLSIEAKIESPRGMAAEANWYANEGAKTGAYLCEALTHPEWAFSEEGDECAWQLGLNTKAKMFEYLDEPEHVQRRKVFSKVMAGSAVTQKATPGPRAFDWDALKPGSLVCDVGGGLGHVAMDVARIYPELQFAVQDTPEMVQDALKFWKHELPEAIDNSRVQFHSSSFFEPQPKYDRCPSVFLLRFVMHDWSDKNATKLLKHLRQAASEETSLVIIDALVAHTCKSDESGEAMNPAVKPPPEPLLRNWGEASMTLFNVNFAVLSFCNAEERTKEGFEEIFEASGWKLREIRWGSAEPNIRPSIIAIPI